MSTTTNAAPLYVQFIAQIRAEIRDLGLPEPMTDSTPSGVPENKNHCFIEWGPHLVAPALIVPKSALRMGNLHSHIDLSAFAGHIALPKANGRVVCHFEPDVSKVSKALSQFVGASKRPVASPVRRLVADSQSASQASVDLTPGGLAIDLFPPTQGVGSYSDDDAEEALQALGRG